MINDYSLVAKKENVLIKEKGSTARREGRKRGEGNMSRKGKEGMKAIREKEGEERRWI